MSISRVSASTSTCFPLQDRFGWLSNPLQQKVQNLLRRLDPIEQESALEFTSNFLDSSSVSWSEEDSVGALELFIEFSSPKREYFVETVYLQIQKNQTEWESQDQLQLFKEFLPLLSSEFEDLAQFTLDLTDGSYTSKQTLQVLAILTKVLPYQRKRFVRIAGLIFLDCLLERSSQKIDKPAPKEMIFIYEKLAELSFISEREAVREAASPWLSTFIGFEGRLIQALVALVLVEEKNWEKVLYCYERFTKTRLGKAPWSGVEKIEALWLIAKISSQNWSYQLNLFERISCWMTNPQEWLPFHQIELLKIFSLKPQDELETILNCIHRMSDAEKICPHEKIRAAKIFLALDESQRRPFADLIADLFFVQLSPCQINTIAEFFLTIEEDEREDVSYWTSKLIKHTKGFELSLIKAISLLSQKERKERITSIEQNPPPSALHIILALQTPFDPSRFLHVNTDRKSILHPLTKNHL